MIFLRKILILTFLVAAVFAVAWWLLQPNNLLEHPSNALPTPPPKPVPHAAINTQNSAPEGRPTIVQPFARTPYLGLADPRWKIYEARRAADRSFEWRTPIEFYGKAVDARDQPVPGASIETSWSGTDEKYGGDGVGHRILTSDPNGLFSLTGVEGKGISVRVTKEGYRNSRTWNNGSFEYAGFWEPIFIEPERNHPVVFHLVKRRVAEPTYHLDGRIIVNPSSLETDLDLLSKPVQKDIPSDLHVRITRAPDASHEKPFDWKVVIVGTNGSELTESNEEFMTLAPNEGYRASIEQEHKSGRSNQWGKMRFYVRNTARGFYAAVELEVAPFYPFAGKNGAGLMIVATINPNYSPNLEYDPEKDIREMAKK